MRKFVAPFRKGRPKLSSKIIYAIPSYQRAHLIYDLSLKMLLANKIPENQIKVFVSSPQELLAYTKSIRSRGVDVDIILAKSTNVVEKFNFVHNYFTPGTRVVFVEDDISALRIKTGENTLSEYLRLAELAEASFQVCEKEGTCLWGISSNANPFYMKDGMSVGFKFVVANLFGFIATKEKFLEVSNICKSDYERTLLYYVKYGSIVRNDGICAITKNYKTAGGLQEMGGARKDLEEKACRALVKRFPHLIEINEKKSKISMYMELKLKTRKKADGMDLMAMQKIMDAK